MTPVMKLIKFDLPINGLKVKTLEELRNNLTDELIVLARSGQLTRWLAVRKHHQEAESVSAAVDNHAEQIPLFLALCESIGVQVDVADVETMFNPPPLAGRPLTNLKKISGEVRDFGRVEIDDAARDELFSPISPQKKSLFAEKKSDWIEVRVPQLSESAAEAMLLMWEIKEGDSVAVDQILVLAETDKLVLEIPAPVRGKVAKIVVLSGADVTSDQVIAYIQPR